VKLQALRALRWLRRGVIFVLGVSVTLIGVVLVVTPGPAIVVVPLGLMILATEFAWARVILERLKERIERLKTGSKPSPEEPDPPAPEPRA